MAKIKIKKGLVLILSAIFIVSLCFNGGSTIQNVNAQSPEKSTFFSTAYIEESDSYNTASDGDLWASCWADDNYLYAANGDGKGFSLDGPFSDIAVSRISGEPPNLTGETISRGNEVGQIWNNPDQYNRKPTGMACVDGNLYLAVQDLNKDFNDVPSATIVMSKDKGKTWTWEKSKPMFDDYVFTTIMFLDYGKDYENAPDDYVYAYGLDNNWRDSFNNRVEDPTSLYLARVPQNSIMDRSTWQFYGGDDANGQPTWSNEINERKPVLQDDRLIYQNTFFSNNPKNMTVLSQGSIVYNKPLNRYIYTSWTEYTFEFYEASTPWGPWKHFMTKDYGAYPWTDTKNGGYATTIPSKFISDDGKTMYVQSNTFMGGIANYNFSLRKLTVEPFVTSSPSNEKDNYKNLAVTGDGVTPINKVAHFGNIGFLNNGIRVESEDSWNGEKKTTDWWGYTWNKTYNLNTVEYTTGRMFPDGGWFNDIKVQVRQNHNWVDVSDLKVTPEYPNNNTAGTNKTYTFTFKDTWGDGARIIGTPGGAVTFTSIGELAVYFVDELEPKNTKPFTIGNASIDFSNGVIANVTVDRTRDTLDYKGEEVVILQLLKNNKEVDLVALKKDIQTSEEMSAYFNQKDDEKKYSVKVFVVEDLNDYLSNRKDSEILSNEMVIKK